MGRYIPFAATTVNGQILDSPRRYELPCSSIVPLQVDVVRQYTGSECIRAVRVFLVSSNGQLLGSTSFKCLGDFIKYANSHCESNCGFYINGCEAEMGDVKVTF